MERPDGTPPSKTPARPTRQRTPGSTFVLLALVVLCIIFLLSKVTGGARSDITYGFFRAQLDADNVAKASMKGMKIYGDFKDIPSLPQSLDKSEGKSTPPRRFTRNSLPSSPRRYWTVPIWMSCC